MHMSNVYLSGEGGGWLHLIQAKAASAITYTRAPSPAHGQRYRQTTHTHTHPPTHTHTHTHTQQEDATVPHDYPMVPRGPWPAEQPVLLW